MVTSRLVLLLAAAIALAPSATARAQSSGTVVGRVVDADTRAPLPGADVRLDGTAFAAASDRTGGFRITGVPAGQYTLLVVYLGHAEQRAEVTVAAGDAVSVDVELAKNAFSEAVQVTAPIGEGQAAALNQQRTALNITNVVSADQIGRFPDPNAAEATSRIPAVSIARDQGEGRYVLIRGTEARLNSMLIDGERIPAPEGDLRQVALDAVPADQLQQIEVSKALTPDMDADAIGGAVNLVTKQAVSRPTMLFSAGGGYNGLQSSWNQGQANLTLGRRFDGGRLGLLVGSSASSLERGSENFEAEYNGGALADMQLRDYQVTRERYGVNAAADVRLPSNGTLTVRGIFNEFKDAEINNRVRFRPPNGRNEFVLKNRDQNQHIRSVQASGQHLLGTTTLDYRGSWAASQEHQPDRLDTIFRQSRVTFAPNVSASSIDEDNIQPNASSVNPAVATLNTQELDVFKTNDRDLTASVNLRITLPGSATSARFLKVGAKIRDKRKDRAQDLTVGSPVGTVPFSQLQDTGFSNGKFLDWLKASPGYASLFTSGIDPAKARAYFNALPAANRVLDRESDANDYEANEMVLAGYAMAELFVNNRLTLLPGVRYERTDVDYTGYEVQFDEDGDYASTRPINGGDTYGFLLPALHVKYAVDDRSNVRAAYTRTLARPNYYDLVPYELVFQEDAEISRGNSTLTATTSDNLDLMAERYFSSVGLISGGAFYKRLGDYIYPFRFRETVRGEAFDVTQPQNGDRASLWGVELALQNQLRFLPAPFDGFGVYANYTWTTSSAKFPGRSGDDATLPGQSTHIGNAALSYEKRGFSARASLNFHGKYLDAVGETAESDVYYDDHTQLDLNVSQRLTKHLRLYVDVLNVTNAPLRYYFGEPNRPIQQEYYRSWAFFGLRANF